jgi:hypothetical protein
VSPTLRKQARKPHQGSPGLRSFSTQELVGASSSGFKSPLPHHSTRSPFNPARSLMAGHMAMRVEWCVLSDPERAPRCRPWRVEGESKGASCALTPGCRPREVNGGGGRDIPELWHHVRSGTR